MDRLKEIKERVGKNALYQEEWKEHYKSDVQYLLAENKRLRDNYNKLKGNLWEKGVCMLPSFDSLREEGNHG